MTHMARGLGTAALENRHLGGELGLEPLFLHIERRWLRWLRHLPPGCLPPDVLTGGGPGKTLRDLKTSLKS